MFFKNSYFVGEKENPGKYLHNMVSAKKGIFQKNDSVPKYVIVSYFEYSTLRVMWCRSKFGCKFGASTQHCQGWKFINHELQWVASPVC